MCRDPLAAPSVKRVNRDVPASWSGFGKGRRLERDDGPALELVPFPVDGPASAMNRSDS